MTSILKTYEKTLAIFNTYKSADCNGKTVFYILLALV